MNEKPVPTSRVKFIGVAVGLDRPSFENAGQKCEESGFGPFGNFTCPYY